MPQDPNNIKRLYNALTSNNFDVGSYDDFARRLQNPQDRQKLYNVATKNNFDLGDYQTYETKLGFGQPQQSLGQRIGGILDEPGATANEGLRQMYSGKYPTSPVAGLANVASGFAKTAGAPIGTAAEAIKAMPDWMRLFPGLTTAPEVVKLGEAILGPIGEFVGGHATNATKYISQGLGASPEAATELAKPVGELFGMGAQALATGGIAKGIMRGGGAIAENVRTTTAPPFIRSKAGILKSANVAFERAVPPVAKELSRIGDRQRIAPYLAESQRNNPIKEGDIRSGGNKPSAMRQLAQERMPEIKNKIWEEQQKIIEPHLDAPLVGGVENIARSIESLRNIYTENVNLLADQSILIEAAKFREMKFISVGQASDMLRSINADLQKFYKQSGESQAAAQNAARPIAEMERAARAIRGGIAETLKRRGENANFYRKLHDDYGSAIRYEVAAERNVVRAENPLAPLFTETSARIYPSKSGTLREIGEHTYGRFFTADKLLVRALDRYAKSDLKVPSTPLGGAIRPRGLLPPPVTGLVPPSPSGGSGYNPQPFAPSPTISGKPQPFTMPDNLRMMPQSSLAKPKLLPATGKYALPPSSFVIPHEFRVRMLKELKLPTDTKITDIELANLYDKRGLNKSVGLDEAPVSRGGSMDVRGAANAEQIRRAKEQMARQRRK